MVSSTSPADALPGLTSFSVLIPMLSVESLVVKQYLSSQSLNITTINQNNIHGLLPVNRAILKDSFCCNVALGDIDLACLARHFHIHK